MLLLDQSYEERRKRDDEEQGINGRQRDGGERGRMVGRREV
jgi:hypothetical protein